MINRRQEALKKIFNIIPWRYSGFFYSIFNHSKGYPRKFKKQNSGKNSYVDPSVQIIGWKNVEMGHNSILSEGTWLNVNIRDKTEKKIIIGNNCHIGKRNFLSSGPLIQVKDYCLTSVDCHFLGCGHNIESPFIPYNASGPSSGKIIIVGVNCWLGTSVTVLEGVQIGYGSVIGARSVVTKSIPPFSIAFGNPCKVVKRYDFTNNKWITIAEWSDELENIIPTEDRYLKTLQEKYSLLNPSLIPSGRHFGWL